MLKKNIRPDLIPMQIIICSMFSQSRLVNSSTLLAPFFLNGRILESSLQSTSTGTFNGGIEMNEDMSKFGLSSIDSKSTNRG